MPQFEAHAKFCDMMVFLKGETSTQTSCRRHILLLTGLRSIFKVLRNVLSRWLRYPCTGLCLALIVLINTSPRQSYFVVHMRHV